MDRDIEPRINSAQHLCDEIARIGGLDRQRSSGQGLGAIDGEVTGFEVDQHIKQGAALPGSPPDSLADRLLTVVIADSDAKEDFGSFYAFPTLSIQADCSRSK